MPVLSDEPPATSSRQAGGSSVADGEPVCIGLYDDQAEMTLDPTLMGYCLGTESWQIEHTIEWLEELRELFGAMAENLRRQITVASATPYKT